MNHLRLYYNIIHVNLFHLELKSHLRVLNLPEEYLRLEIHAGVIFVDKELSLCIV